MVENLFKMYGSGCTWMYLGRIWVYLGCIWVYLGCIWMYLCVSGVYLGCIPKFQQVFKLAESREKPVPTFFAFLPPLYGHFRLSHASQTIDIEKIYRLVSKILNFMPCGSVLGRFCVQCKNFVASASKTN